MKTRIDVLCRQIMNCLSQLEQDRKASLLNLYANTWSIVNRQQLGLVKPTKAARARIEDFLTVCLAEYKRQQTENLQSALNSIPVTFPPKN